MNKPKHLRKFSAILFLFLFSVFLVVNVFFQNQLQEAAYKLEIKFCCEKLSQAIKRQTKLEPFKFFRSVQYVVNDTEDSFSKSAAERLKKILILNPKSNYSARADFIDSSENSKKKAILQLSVYEISSGNKKAEYGLELDSELLK